ncbi:MAG: cytochrome c1 [Deltaproteobacteria bacterium]|nr:cytochrome c1 [Deltaproteobacteria bacterium]
MIREALFLIAISSNSSCKDDLHPPDSCTNHGGCGQVAVTPEVVALPSGLTEVETARFFHLSEGSEFLPLCAIRILGIDKHWSDFGLIEDPVSESNPEGLPIGVTVAAPPDLPSMRMVGFNCAACHVGRISKHPTFQIIGAPSRFDIRAFFDESVSGFEKMQTNVLKLTRFALCWRKDYLKQKGSTGKPGNDPSRWLDAVDPVTDEELRGLKGRREEVVGQVKEALEYGQVGTGTHKDQEVARALSGDWITRLKSLLTSRRAALANTNRVGALPFTNPGPGRVDAFVTAANLMFPDLNLPMRSPVAYPHLWHATPRRWLHWDNNTTSRTQRNIGQAIGVGALVIGNTTTLNKENIEELERLADKIIPPRWPFGALDQARVRRGFELYETKCRKCHSVESFDDTTTADGHLDTDRSRLTSFGLIQGKLQAELQRVERLLYQGSPPPEQPQWRKTNEYGARSLEGIWASPPYLHNNSVPSLEALLSPSPRPKKFVVDSTLYDQDAVGITGTLSNTGEPFIDTELPGNGNHGHTFGYALEDDERRALIEYLKSL